MGGGGQPNNFFLRPKHGEGPLMIYEGRGGRKENVQMCEEKYLIPPATLIQIHLPPVWKIQNHIPPIRQRSKF